MFSPTTTGATRGGAKEDGQEVRERELQMHDILISVRGRVGKVRLWCNEAGRVRLCPQRLCRLFFQGEGQAPGFVSRRAMITLPS